MTPADRIILQEAFIYADREVAAAVDAGKADKGTALATFTALRDGLQLLDPKLADLLIPTLTEAAAPASSC